MPTRCRRTRTGAVVRIPTRFHATCWPPHVMLRLVPCYVLTVFGAVVTSFLPFHCAAK